MLRLKDPMRIPQGMALYPACEEPVASLASPDQTVLVMRSRSLPVSTLFSQYLMLARELRKYYFSRNVGVKLMKGLIVPEIPRSKLYWQERRQAQNLGRAVY